MSSVRRPSSLGCSPEEKCTKQQLTTGAAALATWSAATWALRPNGPLEGIKQAASADSAASLLLGGVYAAPFAGLVAAYLALRGAHNQLMRHRRAEQQASKQALHDPLTGLANRRKLFEALDASLVAHRPPGSMTALLAVDLDRFKPINDLHGHQVGDAVLVEVASRLSAVTRSGETLARLGGDEFAIVLPRLATAADASRPAKRILQALNRPIVVGELSCQLSASVGIAVSDGTVPAADLVRHADTALYAAKRQGRNQLHFFEPEMDAELQRRARLELAFRRGLAVGEVTPNYQPLVDLRSGAVLGYEMLARWQPPGEEPISPDLFIPIAEDTGLIDELLSKLLIQACRDARNWTGSTKLAINVSPVQLRNPKFPDQLLRLLQQHGFSPERLEVEITESALVADPEVARQSLFALKDRGVSIALDDFGTGYSSLHHLRELPFDKLKIDRSFVLSMQFSTESRKIVDAIIAMGRSLGLTTLAEGVENQSDADHLRELGCAMGQGYLFGRPAASLGGHWNASFPLEHITAA